MAESPPRHDAATQELHYRLSGRPPGQRPGSHRGSDEGMGLEFVGHRNLFDHPDARRLDLRASVCNPRGEWLVRVNRQLAAITVQVLVDVSASMRFGSPPKLDVAADFVEVLGHSAFRIGDSLGMVAFDAVERADLFMPASRHRSMGERMSAMLRNSTAAAGSIAGLQQSALRLAGRGRLVFLVSDFHFDLSGLADVLGALSHAEVMPLVVWDAAELQPPSRDALAVMSDAETGRRLSLWMRPSIRIRWRDAVSQRRAELDRIFAAHGLRPFYLSGRFDAQALSTHFLECRT